MRREARPLPQLREVAAFGPQTGWDAAVILPAGNDEPRIAGCLNALADAFAALDRRVGVMLLVGNASDRTMRLGGAVLAARDIPGLVFDLQLDPCIDGTGRLRELGMRAALRIPRGPRALMTTEAPARAAPDWVGANLRELERADVVFGEVLPDPDDGARGDPLTHLHRLSERRCLRLAARIAARLDLLPHDPDPAHRTQSGASLALTAQAFDRLGTEPWRGADEAAALAVQAEALDLRIRHASSPRVVMAERGAGRGEGLGVADDGGDSGGLAAEAPLRVGPWRLCDPWLEPARNFERRYRAKGQLRACWPDAAAVRRLADRLFGLGAPCDPAEFATFGSYWQCLEATRPILRRQRLRAGDLRRELPRFAAAARRLAEDAAEARPPECPTQGDAELRRAAGPD